MKPKVFCVECGSDLDIRHDYGEAGSGWYVERCEVCAADAQTEFDRGYDEGNSDGYSEGWDKGYEAGKED